MVREEEVSTSDSELELILQNAPLGLAARPVVAKNYDLLVLLVHDHTDSESEGHQEVGSNVFCSGGNQRRVSLFRSAHVVPHSHRLEEEPGHFHYDSVPVMHLQQYYHNLGSQYLY